MKYDDRLRAIPEDSEKLRSEIRKQKEELVELFKESISTNVAEKIVARLGTLSSNLIVLDELSEAEIFLRQSLEIVSQFQLSKGREIQQKIRLAQALQHQKKFSESNALYEEVTSACDSLPELEYYRSFAWQHSGKNEFDQENYTRALESFELAVRLRRESAAPIDQIQSSEFAIEKTREALDMVRGKKR